MAKLTEFESKKIIKQAGIAVPRGELVSTPRQAEEVAMRIGLPVVLKIQSLYTGRFEKDLIKIGDSIKAIGDSIKAIGNVDISEYQRLRDAAKNEIDAILIKQGALKRDIESNNSAITSLANRIRHSTVNNTETIKLQRFVSLCDKLLKRLDITLKTNEAHSIKAITKLVQKISPSIKTISLDKFSDLLLNGIKFNI